MSKRAERGDAGRGQDGAGPLVRSEELLALRCQQGEMPACMALLEAYRRSIYSFVRATGRDREWVEDTVVEILLQFYRSIGSFRWQSSLKTWVFSVMTRVCAQELRRAKRPRLRLTGQVTGQGGLSEDPVDLVLERDEQWRALSLVAQLPEKLRVPIALRHLCGCSYTEVADILGIPPGTAKTRVFQGLRQVRRLMRRVPKKRES